MALPQARHDALFRLLVSDPGRAGKLLRDYLPPEVVARLDPEHPPVHVESTVIDGEGSRTQSDAIFRLRLGDGDEAIILALLEHKSRVDHRTPLQLIRYMLRIWSMEMDGGSFPEGGLPLIIPLVFFHGREPWTVPCSIQEMIHAPEGLEHLARSFGHYVLHDLGRIAPQELSRSTEVRAALLALARAFRDSVSDADAGLLVAGVAETEFGRYLFRPTSFSRSVCRPSASKPLSCARERTRQRWRKSWELPHGPGWNRAGSRARPRESSRARLPESPKARPTRFCAWRG